MPPSPAHADDAQGVAYNSSFSQSSGKPLSRQAATSAGQQAGQASKGVDWLRRGWEGTQAATTEAARHLAEMSPQEIGRLKRMLGPTGTILGIGSAGLDAYQRLREGQPLDEVGVRELAKLGLSTVLADAGGVAGGVAGAGGGPLDVVTVPGGAALGAVGGGIAGDHLGDRVGDAYVGAKRYARQVRGVVKAGLQQIDDRYDPNNWTFDEKGRRIYDH